jgi:hypothetical protein
MEWKKIAQAAKDHCGGISPKFLYRAIKAGKLKAAKFGSGRNL